MTAIICMATYNGARWLGEQIDSLLKQTDENWRLLVSDDGSTDGTAEIVREYAERDSRITLLKQRDSEPGVVANFEYLLSEAMSGDADFVMLCDQDDVWRPDKVALQRAQLENARACCSNPTLTNAAGEPLGIQLLSQLNADKEPGISSLLAQNPVVGCTLAMTPAVLELALPFPENLQNHDWWIALCALCEGPLFCDDQALVNYRQHDANVVGAYRPLRQLGSVRQLLSRQRRVLHSNLIALESLRERLSERGIQHPYQLDEYLHCVGSPSLRTRVRALASGEFAAPHRPLRALRIAASLKKLS
ncbi:glycosyltransferase family 2 protein [Congregibacter sp.]|uniref:glycosyltransferase family 2 protein n=1 Tax=Congregibacter sp. TaxID=2744308 RepID=UPI003F6AB1ED